MESVGPIILGAQWCRRRRWRRFSCYAQYILEKTILAPGVHIYTNASFFLRIVASQVPARPTVTRGRLWRDAKKLLLLLLFYLRSPSTYRVGWGEKATNIEGLLHLPSLPSSSQINDYLSIAFSRFCSELVHWFPHSTRPCNRHKSYLSSNRVDLFSSSEISLTKSPEIFWD